MSETSIKIHPRELEIAGHLKEIEFPWEVLTGDWFYADDALHIVMQTENHGEEMVLEGRHGATYEKSKVLWIPHRTTCMQWLNGNDWEVSILLRDDGVHGTAIRRKTGYKVEKKEPTELAVLLALIFEIEEQTHFGWA